MPQPAMGQASSALRCGVIWRGGGAPLGEVSAALPRLTWCASRQGVTDVMVPRVYDDLTSRRAVLVSAPPPVAPPPVAPPPMAPPPDAPPPVAPRPIARAATHRTALAPVAPPRVAVGVRVEGRSGGRRRR